MNSALQVLYEREFVQDCTDLDALSDLMDKKKISFYCGTDPTGQSLHVGHIVPFFAMHHLQKFGHKPVALIGGGTGLIGDPTGKTEMRKMLSISQISENSKRIAEQLSRIVDFSENPPEGYGRAVLVDNHSWLADLKYLDFLRDIGKYFSVNRMLTFESIKQRLERGLSFLEFNYQLLQAYDFYMLYKKQGIRLQIGGADQWGNIVAGIDLIQRMSGPQCFGLTFRLVTRSDGKKMGKSESGAVFLDSDLYSVYDFFQYWRNVSDADVFRFMKIFTFMNLDEIREYEKSSVNINVAKEKLAFEVTKIIHGEEEADKALRGARAAFGSAGEDKSDMPTVTIDMDKTGMNVVDLFFSAGIGGSSKGEIRRLIQGGGASVNGKKIIDFYYTVTPDSADGNEFILKAGKKKYMRVLVSVK